MRFRLPSLAIVLLSSCALCQQTVTRPVITSSAPAGEQSTPVPQAPADQPAPSDVSSYIIGPEDSLQVTVWKEPGISGTFPVRPDGMISLSLIGDLHASGLTPMALSNLIKERLTKFIQNPTVNVAVLTVHTKQIFLLGEVQHVGPVTLVPDMSPLQAISAGGGLTPYANAKKIYILRGQQKIPFDYKKALKEGNQQGVTLVPGDTIVIP